MKTHAKNEADEFIEDIENISCPHCHKKDLLLQKYIKLIDLLKKKLQKIEIGIIQQEGSYKNSIIPKELSGSYAKQTLSTQMRPPLRQMQNHDFSAVVPKSTNLITKLSSIKDVITEDVKKYNQKLYIQKKNTEMNLRKSMESLTEQVLNQKNFMLTIRSIIYQFVRSLNLDNSSENTCGIVKVLLHAFEYSEIQRQQMFAGKSIQVQKQILQ